GGPSVRQAVSLLLLLLLALHVPAQAPLRPADAPTFQLRARVVRQAGEVPRDRKFTFRLGAGSKAATATGGEWSDWIAFGKEQIEATLKGYPAIYLRGYPVVVRLSVQPVVD